MTGLYNPPKHRIDDESTMHDFVRAHPLATLVTSSAFGLNISHIPMLLDAGTTSLLRGHVARPNEHWKAIGDGIEAVAIFHGPQAYVTPQWYPSKLKHGKAVPTWNYAVAHVHGHIRTITDAAWLHAHVSALSAEHEKTFAHQWQVTDAPADFIDKMLTGIVGLEMTITKIEGKWKLNQNRDAHDRAGVVAGMAARDDANSAAVHQLMKKI